MMVRLNAVNKKIGSFELKDISFELPKGYILGIVGQNGAGKTSLINILLGLHKCDRGEVLIDAMDYKKQEKDIKNEIGYVLVEDLFDTELSLIQNGNLYGKYYEKYEKNLFLHYCEEFALDSSKKLKKLSKGEKLKFQFAFALSHHPKLLVLDEPTGNFDSMFQKKFQEIITSFVSDGEHSVILATHLTTDLDKIADYVMFMNKGQVLFCWDKETMNEKYRMVCGEDYKINLLKKEKIVFKEKGQYASKALVRHHKWNEYSELEVRIPTIEEIMYYIVKGGYHV